MFTTIPANHCIHRLNCAGPTRWSLIGDEAAANCGRITMFAAGKMLQTG